MIHVKHEGGRAAVCGDARRMGRWVLVCLEPAHWSGRHWDRQHSAGWWRDGLDREVRG
jgi:hypothetical protein